MNARRYAPGTLDVVLQRCESNFRRRGDTEKWHPVSLSNFCSFVASWGLGSEQAHRQIWEKLKRGEIVHSPVQPGFSYKLPPEALEQIALDIEGAR